MSEKTTHLSLNRILVVDDTTANLQLLTNLLTEQGYTVHPASDGKLALRFIESILPDLILLDIKMPGMDGFEVCRRLKADERTRSIPIIFISILEDERDKVKGFQAGGVDYVTKPFQPEEVLARVGTHLRLRELTVWLEQEVHKRTEELATTNQRLQQELTERKKAHALLRESEEKYRGLIQRIQAAVVVHGADTRILTSNLKAQQLLGLTQEQMMGKAAIDPDWRFFREDGTAMPLEEYPVNQVLTTGQPLRDAVVNVHRPGTEEDVWVLVSADPVLDDNGKMTQVVVTFVDITERKQMEQERLAHLRFFENMDRVNQAIQGADDIQEMMKDLLNVVLSIFDCDRAFLMYPCDPESPTWTSPMERNKPEYPGVLDLKQEMPMDPQIAETLRILLAAEGPVKFGPGTPYPLPEDVSKKFGFRCFMSMAIYPKTGSPWQFGIHQCAYARVWTAEEERLFQEIGRRLADALTILLAYRNLRESEERYRIVFENSPVSIWEEDFSAVKTLFDYLKKQGVTDIETYFDRHPETVLHCAESAKIVDVNRAALALHGAANKEELLAGLVNTFTPESFDTFRRELVYLWNGGTEMSGDAVVKTLTGDRRNVTVYFSVCPGHEEMLSKVLVSIIDITERKRIEEALSSSEAELRTLIEAMTDVIFVGNSEGRYLKIADTSPSLLYKPPNELLGKTLHEVFPKDQADFFLNHIRQALNTQKSVNFEYSLPVGNKEIWFNAIISPMSDDKFLMVARDITDRKQSEEALKNTAMRLNEAQRLAHIGNWELDLMHNVLTWSDEIFRIFEIDPEEFGASYEGFLDAIHPDDREAVNFAYTNSLKTKTPYAIDHRLLFSDGRVKYIHEQCETHYEGDKPIRSIGTVQDITERKLAEEKLKTSEERLRMTLEATQIGIWDWDVTNDRYYASPIYYTLLGYEPKEGPADRSEWVQLLHPDDKKTVFEQVNKVLSRTCDEYSYEARFRHADGSYKWQWVFGYGAGHDKNGKVTRMLGLRIDIDKRKRMEEELSIYREHLEELVRERTAELEAANKELDAFAYSVSHDLRAPLRHIDGFMELLQKKAGIVLDEQARHYMAAISDSGKKMGLLIDDLLSFSRMGRHAISFQQVDLGPLVRDVIRELEPDAVGRDIEWRIGDLPAVGGDASMLRIVFVNLIANALKFTRPRQQAQIEIGSTPNQGSEAVIFVRDNGVGFDMTYVDKLFGVFQRLHWEDEFEGSGIGLASVHRIIARHGGRAWAEGKVDQGATFYFSLPQT